MFAERVEGVAPFLAMEVYERALALERAGRQIIHLEIGEPDFDTPDAVNKAAVEALNNGQTHYTNTQGILELRQALSGWYADKYGLDIDPGRFLFLPGSSPALFLLFTALLNPGDEVIMTDPCYPCYPSFVRFAGGVPVRIPTRESEGFRYEPEAVAASITPRTRALILNSPCNPTGVLMEPERMRALAGLGPLVVSDEIYHGLTYGGEPDHSILEFTDNAVVVGGFSKVYAMTGWRLGYMVLPEKMVPTMRRLAQHFFVCTPAMIQHAAVAAITSTAAEVEAMRQQYDERRKLLLSGLRELGFGVEVEPLGAFYVLANARHLCEDSCKLSLDVLEKAGVGTTPGIDFGPQAEGFLRFSYANSLDNIREALRRLGEYTAVLKAGR